MIMHEHGCTSGALHGSYLHVYRIADIMPFRTLTDDSGLMHYAAITQHAGLHVLQWSDIASQTAVGCRDRPMGRSGTSAGLP